MIALSLMAVAGVGTLLFAMTFFLNRASSERARAVREVEHDIRAKSRQAQEAVASFVPRILDGAPVEETLAEVQKSLAAVLTPDRPIESHLWDLEDLEAYRQKELRRRCEEINRKAMVPALGVGLFIMAITVVAMAITYGQLASRSSEPDVVPSAAIPVAADTGDSNQP